MSKIYNKIKSTKLNISEKDDLTLQELQNIKENAEDFYDLIYTAFKLGYLRGQRANKQ